MCAMVLAIGYHLTTLQERLVHGLVAAYGLLQRLKLIAAPESLPESFLEAFHSPQYITFLKSAEQQPMEESDETDQRHSQSEGEEGFGLQDDCPPFPHVFKYASVVAAATIAAARELMSGRSRIAMNVFGGRHRMYSLRMQFLPANLPPTLDAKACVCDLVLISNLNAIAVTKHLAIATSTT